MQDVADNRHGRTVEILAARATAVQAPADRERVEQRLGRMFVGTVASIDDRGVDPAGVREHERRARRVVPDDDRIRPDRGQRLCSVFEALALRDA